MQLVAHGDTDIGMSRESNEDRFLIDEALGLFVVADGMGGHANGAVAATLAVETAAALVQGHAATLAMIADGTMSTSVLSWIAEQAARRASRKVHDRAALDEDCRGMGCTLTLLLVAGEQGAIAHVGDTRCYRWRDGGAEQLTDDHTLVSELLRMGALRWSDAAFDDYGHILTRALGTNPKVEVDVHLVDLDEGDRFLLCSDGLTAYARSAGDLAECLAASSAETLPRELIDFANEQGGRDNVTVLVVEVLGENGDRPNPRGAEPFESHTAANPRLDASSIGAVA